MHSRLTTHVSRGRVVLARRPWIRWITISVVSMSVAFMIVHQLNRVDAARASWSDSREVFVAITDHSPGDPLRVRAVRLPLAAIPPSALADPAPDAVTRQRVSNGEILVDGDLAAGPGPAAGAEDGTVVVAIADPLVRTSPIGAPVAIYAEGIVLARHGVVVHVDGDVLFISLDPSDAPIVAAAAQSRTASIAFTRD